MDTFKWAYLGAGHIAETTAKELQGGSNEIAAVWNRTFAKAEAFVRKYGGTAYQTPEEAITAPGVEGVYIAVNADQHADLIKRCIRCGKPVLCEKPFTVNRREAEEVFRLAGEKGVYVSEAMWTWHNATALKVKEWVDSGRLGRIQAVRAAYTCPLAQYHIPRLLKNEMIGGALMDIGVYAVTYAYRLFGMPEHIRCAGRVVDDVDHGEQIRMDYPGFSVEIDVAMDRDDGEYFDIIGTEGSIRVPRFHDGVSAECDAGTAEAFRDPHEKKYDVQFSNVAREIRAGLTEGKMVPARSTLAVMGLLDECRKQMGVVYPPDRP